ncbi:DNA polymerase ligase (LigD) domain-containing protein [Hirsutella rhossiliensis]|uniref:DNA polymerase ligase (LigD) domain-containing protein n=1 Tax=Hirsutella rhossiliensis TaxID=111463 RepID=A0A9P8MY46_9HYPO|nr:DNA polymerase ligase (LigD) domain-containing protein [Hirsutella rhossiliensis]KAH0962426.1 DNA polymerase ligase (LigD) domain-containing protein [Hirsutella rhossiliensis]
MTAPPPKRPRSPGLIPNPLVKKRNLQWTLRSPAANDKDNDHHASSSPSPPPPPPPTTAAIESGAVLVTDHLAHFTLHLSARVLVASSSLSVPSYAALYRSNAGSPLGAHFVVHQHDHPVAGTHYDLRLQINETSSVSWAVMYGLPGDPNSKRLNRNATETRIHSLWNHLIETASPETGSLLIWDTGTYSILPRRSKHAPRQDPSSPPTSPPSSAAPSPSTQQALLEKAFHSRKIRLRLHGSKLPDPYVLNLRLTKAEDASGRSRSLRCPRTRRRRPRAEHAQPETSSSDDDDHADDEDEEDDKHIVVPPGQEADPTGNVSALDRELRELEDDQVRRTNAYPGAVNTIGSIHQRRCVVTGRRGEDVLRDEQVTSFVRRQGWAPVLN